ncbi:hypothetical protein F2P56_035952 [Juglans regia]|uniref:Protein FAR1-RELATED SEQUENCE n=1 Tax=Juglans regia TaxID=51240 RepID=A0A833X6Q6_JUGRE|nr:hypothetical protein F2P56_035952 [Juglans regia]
MDANTDCTSTHECDEVVEDTNIECDETIEQPMVGMNFSYVEEVWSYYKKYGKQTGFGVCKRNSRQDDDGNVSWICLACVHGGTSKSKAVNIMKPRQTEKIGCMARINAVLNDEGGYTLSKVILDHTHVCSPKKTRHFRYFKKVDARVAKRLEINDEAGIRLSKNFKAVVVEVGRYENVSLGEECQNYIDKARQLCLGVGDARSRAAYESFGDVIVFYTTYLTNVYKMPFAPFLKCMNDQPPNAIITDQDKVMKIAISRMFPTSRHRFCLWHIMKKLPEKFESHSRYEEIKSTLHRCIYNSLSELEFESQWLDMLDTYNLHENAWFVSLYTDRRFWVPTYVRDTFWYDSALRRKVENEAIADFNSFNTETLCITRYPLEKSTFEVVDEIQVGDDLLKHATFTVRIDEDPLDVKCSYRWRKDVKYKYTFVKSSYDTSSIDDAQMYDRIQNCFYELYSNASKSESSCVKLINQIEQLKVQYPRIADPITSTGGTIVDRDTSIRGTTVDPITSMGGTTGKVLSPLVVRSKRRPSSKRKVHPAEKSLKKSSTRRQLHHDEAERSSQAPDECTVSNTHHEAPQTQDQQSQV